jgi:hypothetical protein
MSLKNEKSELKSNGQDFQSFPKMRFSQKNSNSSSNSNNYYYFSKKLKQSFNTVVDFSANKNHLQIILNENKIEEKHKNHTLPTEGPKILNKTSEMTSSLMNGNIFYSLQNKFNEENRKIFYSESSSKSIDNQKNELQFDSLQVFMKKFRDQEKGLKY